MTEQAAGSSGKSFLIFLASLVVLVGTGIGLGSVLFGPKAARAYDRSTPDAVLEAAKQMVLNNEAERLTELLYVDVPEMEGVYQRLGSVLGHLQDLAVAINERFPEEVAAMRAKAEEEAKAGRGVGLLQQLGSTVSSGRSRRGPPAADDENRWNGVLQTIASDPYSWLTEAEGRLSYAWIDDERVAVLWDEKPVFPPFGLVMQQDRGQWTVVLPLKSIPMASRFLPQTPDEHAIWGAVFQAVDNVVIDLERDVREGRLTSLESLSRATGQKAAPVMAGVMIAYGKALEERRRRERAAREAATKPESDAPEDSGGG
ncbi:MAG: hypothetical protein HND58_09005 [Planctomycetota bacterium]|nr:MAG: hypothetical protein HND58_09005 [Planctomycetota bacterium]